LLFCSGEPPSFLRCFFGSPRYFLLQNSKPPLPHFSAPFLSPSRPLDPNTWDNVPLPPFGCGATLFDLLFTQSHRFFPTLSYPSFVPGLCVLVRFKQRSVETPPSPSLSPMSCPEDSSLWLSPTLLCDLTSLVMNSLFVVSLFFSPP